MPVAAGAAASPRRRAPAASGRGRASPAAPRSRRRSRTAGSSTSRSTRRGRPAPPSAGRRSARSPRFSCAAADGLELAPYLLDPLGGFLCVPLGLLPALVRLPLLGLALRGARPRPPAASPGRPPAPCVRRQRRVAAAPLLRCGLRVRGEGPEPGRLELLRQPPAPDVLGGPVVDGRRLERLADLAQDRLGRLAAELVACGVDEPVEGVAQALDRLAGVRAAAELSLARGGGGVEELVEVGAPPAAELVDGPGGDGRLWRTPSPLRPRPSGRGRGAPSRRRCGQS